MAELLLDRGAEVDARDKYDDTPLHKAAFQNAHQAAELLLDRGAERRCKGRVW